MKCIKRHPYAFVCFIALEIIGLVFLLAVYPGEVDDWVYALVGLTFTGGCAMMVIALLVWVVKKVIAEKNTVIKSPKENELVYDAVRNYMNQSPFNAAFWIVTFLLSPITFVLLVHVLDYYMMGGMIMALGLMIFLIITNKDILESAFFRVRNADGFFRTESGEDRQLLDSLYGDYVHAYLLSSWDELHRSCIYNALRREKALNGEIRCFTVSNRFLHEQYGTYLNERVEGYVLVPFSQFALNGKNGHFLRQFFDSISGSKLNNVVNSAFGSKKSLAPEDYAHSAKYDILRPMIGDILNVGRAGSDLSFAVTKATQNSDIFKQYYDCLMVIRGAQLDGGEEAQQLEERLIASDTRYFSGFELSVSGRVLTMKVVIDDDTDAENWDMDEHDYSPVHELVYHYDRIEWYYDAFCDASKAARLFKLIQPAKKTGAHSVEEA